MKKKLISCMLLSVLTLSLAACSSEKTSTTTFTTSYTDENGETHTNTTTTTTENGKTTTEETTTTTTAAADTNSAYEPDESDVPTLRDQWAGYFNYGAEGKTNEGEHVLFIYDDPDKLSMAAIMIISSDDILTNYDIGNVREDEEYYVIEDVDGDEELPFSVPVSEDEYFVMGFQDGSTAEMYYVDKDTILNDMVGIVEQVSKSE